MEKRLFGMSKEGLPVYEYGIGNGNFGISVLSLGGIIRTMTADGRDIVAGFDSIEDYYLDDSYQGGLIGRTCNRIRDGKLTLNGETVTLTKNEPKASLHGGREGFNRKVWTVEEADDSHVSLSYVSPDGEEGYPGKLSVHVTYTIYGNALKISYYAVSDKDTPVCMTNHSYFNLRGYGSGDILSHRLWIDADSYTEVDGDLLPTGKHIPVEGTPYDFRVMHEIGGLMEPGFDGYDNNYILNNGAKKQICGENLPHVATMQGGKLEMKVYTTEPCMQLYIGNMLTGEPTMKGGYQKAKHSTVCLETQIEPDSYSRGTGILTKGESYSSVTVYEVKRI